METSNTNSWENHESKVCTNTLHKLDEISNPGQLKEHILFLIQRNDLNTEEIIQRLKKIDILLETLNVQLKTFMVMSHEDCNIDLEVLIKSCWETIKIHEDTKGSILEELMCIKQDNEKLREKIVILEEEIQHLESLNKRDAYTWLYNKKTFLNALDRIIDNPINSTVIVFLDIDNFKAINGNFGHTTWDIVIEHFAYFLDKNLDKSKTAVFRYGWEEFTVISRNSPEIVISQLESTMNDLKNNFIPENLTNWISLELTFSAWVTKYNPKIHKQAKDIIDDADNKCKVSKNNGKDQITA